MSKKQFFKWTRTLHIHVSMFAMMIVLFFALTGFTLNHPDWFSSDEPYVRSFEGKIADAQLKNPDKLAIVEKLRNEYPVSGAVTAFEIDEYQMMVDFKKPGHMSNAAIDRETGDMTVTVESYGMLAIINDLHMGRNSGGGWAVLIDLSAALLGFVSISGMILLLSLIKRRNWGLAYMATGTLASVAVYLIFVP